MTIAGRTSAALLLAALALPGCGEEKPMLTFEALAAAAERCGARELEFIRPGKASEAPSFSYLDPGPAVEGKPSAVSTCLAEALSGYRFSSMTIRFEPSAPAGPASK